MSDKITINVYHRMMGKTTKQNDEAQRMANKTSKEVVIKSYGRMPSRKFYPNPPQQ